MGRLDPGPVGMLLFGVRETCGRGVAGRCRKTCLFHLADSSKNGALFLLAGDGVLQDDVFNDQALLGRLVQFCRFRKFGVFSLLAPAGVSFAWACRLIRYT